MNEPGVIAIGRNEGERLRRCLASVVGRGMPVVYVDSASTDGSADLAQSMGAEVVDLDVSIPFSAARARNEGIERLLQIAPGVRFVFFVDGDCEVVEGWLERAVRELEADLKAAVVCGRRRERHPEASVYNRLADLEGDRPPGEVQSCGGDAVMRVEAFRRVGGFDPSVVAGEDPELCQRLREAGWTIRRVDAEMTIHDSAMLRFRQWWRRAVRSGYGAMDVATRFRRGPNPLFVEQVTNARRWAIGFPLIVLAACVASALIQLDGTIQNLWVRRIAFAGPWFVLLFLPLQMLRLALKVRKRIRDWPTATAYGVLTMIGKWAHVAGQRQYQRDRAAGKNTRLIDYKAAGSRQAETAAA
jgi:cellulose synthase/poly-beta-1,6-N-acetylglucosamine synthase-like glycosyltransferase